MREIRYADEGMDMKKFGLCLIGKSWLVLVAAALGALLGAAVYGVVRIVPESEREYRAMAKIYLDFETDETGEVYQMYNGYTWNDLMATDPILDVTMAHLPSDYTREEVMAATKAEILSDLRLLTVTVTTHDRDRCNAILQATGQSLTERGDTAKEFQQITVIQTTDAKLVTADSRMRQAALLGIVAAVALTLIGMLFYYVLDDRILVAGDLRKVTDVSFMGYAGAGERFHRDYAENLADLRRKRGTVCLLAVSGGSMPSREALAIQGISPQETDRTGHGQPMAWEQGIAEEQWRELCAADGVVLAVSYGRVHAAYLSYIMEQLQTRECRLAGVAVSGADVKFLRRYYGAVFGRNNEIPQIGL